MCPRLISCWQPGEWMSTLVSAGANFLICSSLGNFSARWSFRQFPEEEKMERAICLNVRYRWNFCASQSFMCSFHKGSTIWHCFVVLQWRWNTFCLQSQAKQGYLLFRQPVDDLHGDSFRYLQTKIVQKLAILKFDVNLDARVRPMDLSIRVMTPLFWDVWIAFSTRADRRPVTVCRGWTVVCCPFEGNPFTNWNPTRFRLHSPSQASQMWI